MNRVERIVFFVLSLNILLIPSLNGKQRSRTCCAELTSTISVPPTPNNPETGVNYVRISHNGKCAAVTSTPAVTTLPGSVSLFPFTKKGCALEEASQTVKINGARALAYSPDGKTLVVGDQTRNIYVFKVEQCRCRIASEPRQIITFAEDVNPADIVFSPNGKFMAVALLNTHQIAIFGVNEKKHCITPEPIDTYTFSSPSNSPFSLAFSPEGTCLLAVLTTNALALFRFNSITGSLSVNPQFVSTNPTNIPLYASFSPHNTCVAVTNSSPSITLFSFDHKTCTLSDNGTVIPLSIASPLGITFSDDGACLIVVSIGSGGGNGGLTIFRTGEENCTVAEQPELVSITGNPLFVSQHKKCFVVSNLAGNNGQVLSYRLTHC